MRWTSWMPAASALSPAACRASGRSAPACSRDFATAAQQGQRIYTLTRANQAQLNDLAISAAAKQDIAAALNANREVTVHQHPITHAGWTGEGYIVIDPETGAGAYKISGGGNGAAVVAATTLYGIAFFSTATSIKPLYTYVAAKYGKTRAYAVVSIYAQLVIPSLIEGYQETLMQIWKIRDSQCADGIKWQLYNVILVNELIEATLVKFLGRLSAPDVSDPESVAVARSVENWVLFDLFPGAWDYMEIDQRVISDLENCKGES